MMVLVGLLATGCDSCDPPCQRLADRACLEQGNGSPNCIEIRKRAQAASDEDQRYCRGAISILDEKGGSAIADPNGP